MIKLKNGKDIAYNENFDIFYQNLLSGIITESAKTANEACGLNIDMEEYNKLLLKEVMDNSIFITHQLFEISKVNENLSKFIITGFLFNCIVMSIPNLNDYIVSDKKEETIH